MKQNEALYWWETNGENRGPVALEKLRDLVRNGTIARTSSIWSEGWEDWRSITSMAQALAIPMRMPVAVAPVSATPVAARPVAKKRSFLAKLAIGFGVLFALFVLLLVFGPRGTAHEEYEAQLAIQRLLKAPSTAKFLNVVVMKEEDGNLVVGDVDAQNAFGAMIRSRWIVKMRGGKVESAIIVP